MSLLTSESDAITFWHSRCYPGDMKPHYKPFF